MAQIFLCYADPDRKTVEEIYRRLSAERFRPWMHSRDIFGGEDKKLSIRKAIKNSDFFLAFLSSHSVSQAGLLQRELKWALDQWEEKQEDAIYLIPVILDACPIPHSLSAFQAINDPLSEAGLEQIVTAIKEGLRRSGKDATSAPPPPVVKPAADVQNTVIPPPALPTMIGPSSVGLAAGTMLGGRYLIEREIGQGGFAVVYLASDQKLLPKRVVIKVLKEESASNTYLMKKFDDEIKALARINHPGVVGAQDKGETLDRKPYLVMQFVEGNTLRSVIKDSGMECSRVAVIMRQIGRALSAAHEKGVWHRDLKPENIVLQDLGAGAESVTLIDFGIATVRDSSEELAENTITKVIGSPLYMAPEQIKGQPEATSDVYAMGVIAYEMITGTHPFKPMPFSLQRLYELQQAGVKENKPRVLRPDLPVPAQIAILKALSFRPQDRYRLARDFGDALHDTLLKEGPVKIKSTRFALFLRATAIAVIALVCAVLLAWLIYRDRACSSVSGKPEIHITEVPPYDPIGGPNSSVPISGTVSGVDPQKYVVLVYSRTTSWYVQPQVSQERLKIINCAWNSTIHTGTEYAALLVSTSIEAKDIPSPTSNPSNIPGVIAIKIMAGKQ